MDDGRGRESGGRSRDGAGQMREEVPVVGEPTAPWGEGRAPGAVSHAVRVEVGALPDGRAIRFFSWAGPDADADADRAQPAPGAGPARDRGSSARPVPRVADPPRDTGGDDHLVTPSAGAEPAAMVIDGASGEPPRPTRRDPGARR